MKKLLAGLIALIMIMITAACSNSASVTSKGDSDYTQTTITAATRTQTSNYFPSNGGESIGKTPMPTIVPTAGDVFGSNTPVDRMVVRTGNISIVVSDIGKTIDSITNIAKVMGGYVVTSQKWKDGDRNYGNISIRILAENYDKTVTSLRGMSLDVINETTSSQDVTEEYSDLGASLKNLEATETQLLKIMESATRTEDILSIQRELTNVRGQIEQIKGRMQYLERTTATSLININLSEAVIAVKFSADKVHADIDEDINFSAEINGGFAPYNYQWDFGDGNTSIEKSPTHAYLDAGVYSVSVKVTDDKGYTNSSQRSEYINITGKWNAGSVVKSAWNGFATFGRGFVNVVIWLAIFSPVWIIIGVIIWLIVRRSRKKKA
jgi:PKD repeat protein